MIFPSQFELFITCNYNKNMLEIMPPKYAFHVIQVL